MVRQLKPCGTNAAFERHYRYGEKPCDPCRAARATKYRLWYWKAKGGEPFANTAPRIIADHLETFGTMSIRDLGYLIQHRHDIEYETIRRAVHRMITDGRLRSVKDWQGRLRVGV